MLADKLLDEFIVLYFVTSWPRDEGGGRDMNRNDYYKLWSCRILYIIVVIDTIIKGTFRNAQY